MGKKGFDNMCKDDSHSGHSTGVTPPGGFTFLTPPGGSGPVMQRGACLLGDSAGTQHDCMHRDINYDESSLMKTGSGHTSGGAGQASVEQSGRACRREPSQIGSNACQPSMVKAGQVGSKVGSKRASQAQVKAGKACLGFKGSGQKGSARHASKTCRWSRNGP